MVVVLLVLGCQHILSTYLSPELLKQRQRRFWKVPAASEAVPWALIQNFAAPTNEGGCRIDPSAHPKYPRPGVTDVGFRV